MELKKIAFFVEGYTEQEFVKKLLLEVFGSRNIQIEVKQVKGGGKGSISVTTLESPTEKNHAKYFVLIYNCGGDSSIKSYILDQRMGLANAGYSKIVGLRDVYPIDRVEIQRLLDGLKYGIPQKEIPISFVLSIMEIEAWFLAEENHFLEIDKQLSTQAILDNFGFSPESHDTESVDEPANTLHRIYSSVGKAYQKKQKNLNRTINALDYSNLYFSVQHRIKSLKELVEEIEDIFN